jgi:hypothetical protein
VPIGTGGEAAVVAAALTHLGLPGEHRPEEAAHGIIVGRGRTGHRTAAEQRRCEKNGQSFHR